MPPCSSEHAGAGLHYYVALASSQIVLSHLLDASALFISHWGDSKVSWCWNIFAHVFAVPSTTQP